jgi:hypothetical protein
MALVVAVAVTAVAFSQDEAFAGNVSSDLDADLVAEMMVRVSASFLAIPATSSTSTTASNWPQWPGSSSYPCWTRHADGISLLNSPGGEGSGAPLISSTCSDTGDGRRRSTVL